jgi:hypothetical protein
MTFSQRMGRALLFFDNRGWFYWYSRREGEQAMSTMITEVYDAFIAAGAPEEKAKAAARALADYDSRFNRVDQELALIKAEIMVLKWMLGFVLAGIASLVFKAFS